MTGTGDLGSLMATLQSGTTYIWGGAFEDFKTRYINDTGVRATNLTALAEVLGQAVAAEKEVWSKVNTDLESLAEKYVEGFNKIARGDGGDVTLTFAVISAALAGVGLFATGIGATVAAGMGIALNLAKAMGSHPTSVEEKQLFGDVSSGLSALHASLDALSNRIYDEESQIISGLEKIDRDVRDNSDLFQLSPAPIYQSGHQKMGVEPPAISIATKTLPMVSQGVLEVTNKPKLIAADLRSALDRNYHAGNSTAGAAPTVEEIAYLLKTFSTSWSSTLTMGQNY